jgi:4-carboxymuconolactone decarboxylase
MKQLAATALAMSLAASAPALAEDKRGGLASPALTIDDVRSVSPALEKYTKGALLMIFTNVL